MNALFTSWAIIFLAETGDKTQLLAFSLAHRFQRPWAVMAGIGVATLVNHALSAWAGSWAASHIPPVVVSGLLAVSFIAFGVWTLIPDTLAENEKPSHVGAFLTTTWMFFLTEIGDKTQLATMALGAEFKAPITITIGTTLGMLMADGLVVFLGGRIASRVPVKWIRIGTAVVFFVFGVWSALSVLRHWL
jgi:Ca2+/H+ antiporter, TMEM165/GDT1 family